MDDSVILIGARALYTRKSGKKKSYRGVVTARIADKNLVDEFEKLSSEIEWAKVNEGDWVYCNSDIVKCYDKIKDLISESRIYFWEYISLGGGGNDEFILVEGGGDYGYVLGGVDAITLRLQTQLRNWKSGSIHKLATKNFVKKLTEELMLAKLMD